MTQHGKGQGVISRGIPSVVRLKYKILRNQYQNKVKCRRVPVTQYKTTEKVRY